VARLDASTIMFLEIAVPLGDVGADWQNVLLNFTKAQKAFALGDDLNRPGNCGDSFAWKGKSNVHTEEEAHAAGEEAAAGWFPAEISA